ncbi:hypothetical protein GCM10023185_43360 [Hymenobacter saemangeumensis]|uniref:Lipoprotein n=1 Tax=Hymenobacter saemangeumensis TaxID=1084522 RepID=A0ABP8ISE0_9BACT
MTHSTVIRFAFAWSLLALAPACVSMKPTMKYTPSAAIANRLPAVEVTADQGPLAMNDGALPEDPLAVFKQECRVNLTEPTDSAAYGYARFVVKKVNTIRLGRGLQAFQMATLLLPSVFGIPLEWYQTTLQAEVQVTDADGNILGSYTGTGTSKVKVAMYHGYSQSDAPRLADIIAMRNALAQIRPQLDTASLRLRPLLMAGGTVENPTLSSSARPEGQ